jgi:hypothetical protein
VSLVRDIYRYKGVEISSAVNKALKQYTKTIPFVCSDSVILQNTGWGEISLLTALEHPDVSFIAIEPDEERRRVAQYAAEVVAPNLTYVETMN